MSKKISKFIKICLIVLLVFSTTGPIFIRPVFAQQIDFGTTETVDNFDTIESIPLPVKETQVLEPDNTTPDIPVQEDPSLEPIEPTDMPSLEPTELLPKEEMGDRDETGPVDIYADRDNTSPQPYETIGQYNVDEFTGLFTYNFPIEVPQGRASLQPDISLQYNHRQMNLGSMVGFGWNLTMPSIERENRTGVDNIYSVNYFSLNLNGSGRLEPIDIDGSGYGTYGKQVESDFMKIEYDSSNKWIVTDKLGTIYTFGSTATARQDDPQNSSRVYRWMLEEVRDTNNNYIKYEYYKNSGQIYPKKITYTGHDTTDGIFEVDFEPFANGTPTENNVTAISYQAGFEVETKYLLDSVDIKIDGDLYISYELDINIHSGPNNTDKALLDAVIPIFYKNNDPFINSTETFSYSVSDSQFYLSGDDSDYDIEYLGEDPPGSDSKRDMFIDLNQDGYADHIRMTCDNETQDIDVGVALNDTQGGWIGSNYGADIGGDYYCQSLGVYYSIPVAFAELNGDHLIDMVDENLFYINTGSSWQTESGSLPVSLYQSTGNGQLPMNAVIFQDMNQDGYDDIVYEIGGRAVEVYLRNPETSG